METKNAKILVLHDYEDYFCDDNHSESDSMNGFQLGEVVYDQLGNIGIIGAFYGKGEVRLDSNGVTDIDNIKKCPADIAAEAISHKQKIRNKTHKVPTTKITEDYVSFEVAKLLKEKGFDEYCGTSYTTADGKPIRVMGSTYPLEHNGKYDKHHYSMPSQSMAMKWLRELYNIHILIDFANDCKSYWPRLYVYHDDRNIEAGSYYSKWEEVSEFGYYDTHEEAVEAALKYVLENFETLTQHLFTNN